MDTVVFKPCKDPFKRILLAETIIGIAVAVFYAYDMVADDSYLGCIRNQVGWRHICLSLDKLMVEIEIIFLSSFNSPVDMSARQAVRSCGPPH